MRPIPASKMRIKWTKTQEDQGVEFILTDLHPYNLAWQNASKASKSGTLRYIPVPVDASLLTEEALGSASTSEARYIVKRSNGFQTLQPRVPPF